MILAAAIAVAAIGAAGGGFTGSGTPRALSGAPGFYEWRFEAVRGPSPFDRIALHRLAPGPNPPQAPKAVLLFLPGTNMNGEVAPDDPHHNFAEYLASEGIDTWSLDYRTHFVPPDASEASLAELKDWTNALFESDIDAAADWVMSQTHRQKIFVAGFSRGGEFAYLYAARHPKDVAGLVILDSYMFDRPMATGKPERYATDVGGAHLTYDKRKTLMELVIRNPDGLAPIPKYKTARENLEHVLYDAGGLFGGHGGVSNALNGISDPVVLARVLVAFDRYWPAVQNYEAPFTPELKQALAQSGIPVIAFSSTNISPQWPGKVRASAQSTGYPAPLFKALDGWGHLDVLAGNQSESEVYAPTAKWIMQRAK